jgi:hypothetical protein
MKKDEIVLIFFLVFTLIYATIGDPNNETWSGLYFIVNYFTLLVLFASYRSKIIRLIGISLSLSILVYIVSKYFLHLEIERYYTIIPFTICLTGLILIERNESRKRKNI